MEKKYSAFQYLEIMKSEVDVLIVLAEFSIFINIFIYII